MRPPVRASLGLLVAWAIGACVCAAAIETTWKHASAGDEVRLFALPAARPGAPPAKVVWELDPMAACGSLRPSWVSLRPPGQVLDTVVDAECVSEPVLLAAWYERRDGGSEVPAPFWGPDGAPPQRGNVTNGTLVLREARVGDSGMHVLSVFHPPNATAARHVVFLKVAPRRPEPAGGTPPPRDDEEGGTEEPATPAPPPHPHPIAEVAHVRGVTVSLRTQTAILFAPGDTVHTDVSVMPIAHDDDPYVMEVVWVRFDVPEECGEMRIYEPCLYHPQLPECRSPADAPCAASVWTERLAVRRYGPCSRGVPPPRCPSDAAMESRAGLGWYGHTVNLQLRDASEASGGLYVCVVYVNGHVHAWGHVVISTASRYRNAVVERSPPRYRPPPVEPTPSAQPTGPRPAAPRAARLVGVLGAAVGLAVAGLSVWACVTCRRARAWRAVKRRDLMAPTYIRLADDELYGDLSSYGDSDDSEYDSDSDRLPGTDPAPKRGSGFQILSGAKADPWSAGARQHGHLITFRADDTSRYRDPSSPDPPHRR
ncbi:envelope glycoprotein E [Macacine alphaherpesvirus 1]|uniref:Envelope glycoprotein E n=1 Tax=Cercopithecine herpesvirus 1 (strain E2490) TaxID=260965 RepID=GE_CHV1E|nr:envelope glycoprotein E [Macacine alphaherpesvirus 1]P30816.2 RecName: Full=Envelope glycoprotein E; Short=gE; Flags: Precursor [Macacine alphaherpesvirus 1]AAP41485.1 virion glycoprotein E [Macacine alphaherpesvirus 1]ARS01929.1 envelope glycoprotein E [Macacine alphaherpesvirus 1]ARS02887.1 envelope glycoprotein E [Macacine alphaherpesvirus 1]BAB83755.1 glycoprotein gE [Macacine alphaherpesvirus 1]